MSLRAIHLVGAVVIATVLFAGCGESEEDQRAEERYREALQEYRTDLKDWKKDQVTYDECSESMEDFRSAIKELDGRLDVGLNYEDYAEKVGDAAAVYSQSDFEGGGYDCLGQVGLPLESALTQYKKAYDVWQECFDDFDCETATIEGALQKHWGKANTSILRSDSALDSLKVGPRPEPPEKPQGT